MAPAAGTLTPGLASFLRSVSSEPVENSIEYFIALLKRRQISGSKPCAIATAYLLRRAVSLTRASEPGKLIQRVLEIGKRLVSAAPRELAVGNVVRRVLGLIRDEEDENRGDGDFSGSNSEMDSGPATPRTEHPQFHQTSISAALANGVSPRREGPGLGPPSASRPPLLSSHTGVPVPTRPVTSMFSILSHPTMIPAGAESPVYRSGTATPQMAASVTDLRAEILEGISEIIDELDQADDQIANYALEHIHPQEIIFTYSSSLTVQRFLLKAASKRKFTVIHAEAYPNNHSKTHSLLTGNQPATLSDDENLPSDSFSKPLTALGITVILVPDSSIFALMSRASKVVLSAHAVLSNGSMVAPAGARSVVKAARFHRVPVMVLAATYKLSPLFPYDSYALIEYGDVGKVIPYQDAEMRGGLKGGVRNPIHDFVDSGDVDLFVTNLGGVSTGYLYRVVRDQYREEDLDL